jgi:hypothetical protein
VVLWGLPCLTLAPLLSATAAAATTAAFTGAIADISVIIAALLDAVPVGDSSALAQR